MHVETPATAGENMGAGWQPERQAIDAGVFDPIDYPADLPVYVHPIKEAILTAVVLGPNLLMGLEAAEVPVNIIGWADRFAHCIILLRFMLTLSLP
jgi:hypothetical protein